jgi:hypothetical protein
LVLRNRVDKQRVANLSAFALDPEDHIAGTIVPSRPVRGAKPARGPKLTRRKAFAIIPLENDWGYQALTIAERGAAIVAHVLYIQRTTGRGDVPITASVLRRCGLDRRTRTLTIDRLVEAGIGTVKRRGKSRGCPLLTLIMPEEG